MPRPRRVLSVAARSQEPYNPLRNTQLHVWRERAAGREPASDEGSAIAFTRGALSPTW